MTSSKIMIDWIAHRTRAFDSSGIRRVFDLAAQLDDPINLSIGQPNFDVPAVIRDACVDAIQSGKNGYALTQGIPALRDKLESQIRQDYGGQERSVFVSSGTSGGLMLAMLALVNPGDEVIVFDPYFVMYEPLISLVGGVPVVINTYPDFHIDRDIVAEHITPQTKLILLNSPGNPTGTITSSAEIQDLALLAADRGVVLLSDEIYSQFCYDKPFVSPATYNSDTLVIDGFSKSHAMTGWRVGWAHGPAAIIETMVKLQQYTFVCSPQPAQWAAVTAMDCPTTEVRQQYQAKRDRLVDGIRELYELASPGGAFYLFPKTPWGTGTEFVEEAIRNNLLIIPGKIFSKQDTHFRISYAAEDRTIDRGIEVLRKLAVKY